MLQRAIQVGPRWKLFLTEHAIDTNSRYLRLKIKSTGFKFVQVINIFLISKKHFFREKNIASKRTCLFLQTEAEVGLHKFNWTDGLE